MSHRVLRTAANVIVNHSHLTPDLTAAQKASIQANALATYAGIQALYYVHLNLSPELLGPTRDYNCWGFTFNPRQCWINSGNDVQNILDANGTQVYAPNLRIGDVICYKIYDSEEKKYVITHTGRVWSLTAGGGAALIQSKWGAWGEYLHAPLTVPAGYGTNVTYWRCTPLKDKGDAWHKDNTADDRLPYPPGCRWLSPDVWCNNSGGTTHQNPVRGQANKLYARVHNADSLAITNGSIRIYWADPNGGIPPADWNHIGSATVNVAAGTTAITPPVTWTPGPSVPNHCCLLAIANTGDDPFAGATLDPIVWPFDVSRDNNIIQRNISVVAMPPSPPSPPPPLPFTALNPYPFAMPVEVRIDMRRIVPRELAALQLDLQPYRKLFDDKILAREWRFRAIRPQFTVKLDVHASGELERVKPTTVSTRGLVLRAPQVAPGEGGRLKLLVQPTRNTRPGQIYRIDLEQRVGGEITGGMTYIVVITPERFKPELLKPEVLRK